MMDVIHKRSEIKFYSEGDRVKLPQGGILLKGMLRNELLLKASDETETKIGMRKQQTHKITAPQSAASVFTRKATEWINPTDTEF